MKRLFDIPIEEVFLKALEIIGMKFVMISPLMLGPFFIIWVMYSVPYLI